MVSTIAAQVGYGLAAALTSCICFLKFYTRIRYVGGLKTDDYLALTAWTIFLLDIVFTFLMLDIGLQKPKIEWLLLGKENLTRLLKYFFISNQLYIFGILFNKLNLIFLYKRITHRAQTLQKIDTFLTYLAAFCTLFALSIFCVNMFLVSANSSILGLASIPSESQYEFQDIISEIRRKWFLANKNIEHCSTKLMNNSVFVWQAFNIITDLLIMATPYFLLSAAALHRTQRIALYALFSLTALIIVSSIMKIVGIVKNFEPASLVFWSIIEGCVVMCVACLPSLPPLIWRSSRVRSTIKNSARSLDTTGDRSILEYKKQQQKSVSKSALTGEHAERPSSQNVGDEEEDLEMAYLPIQVPSRDKIDAITEDGSTRDTSAR